MISVDLRDDLSTRSAYAHDASPYLLRPVAVARPHSIAGIQEAFAIARSRGIPVTFRSGGTSLAGQCAGDGLLVDTRAAFTGTEVLDDGARVRCGPGATLRSVNAHLARYGARLGPDPASEIACTIGGVVANNSSGMSCGTTGTAYATVDSLTLVLPSGTVLETGSAEADALLRTREPALYQGLAVLRDRIMNSPDARRRIAEQYSMKNTLGYAVNSFVDFSEPARILEHLAIGSEGTLAFIASAVFRTVPSLPCASTALLMFESIDAATAALEPLIATNARAIELLDAASLRVGSRNPHAGSALTQIAAHGIDRHTALLVEYQCPTLDELGELEGAARGVIAELPLVLPANLTRDGAERTALWQVRKGLYTAVAGARSQGTTALLEDLAVPRGALSSTVAALGELFAAHGYSDAVTFGHARDGNLHFMISPCFDDESQVQQYAAFTEDMVDVVLDHRGTLKAEHGTGRAMAPFVRRQFGDELYEVMREVKALCDPENLLNPGVLLSDDPRKHLRDLKSSVAVDDRVDRCVECGYCEPTCPSHNVTTTPRQRIALLREMSLAGDEDRATLKKSFDYAAVDTCAVDSLCTLACPVGIDTGAVMKSARAERFGPLIQGAGRVAAEHWGGAVTAIRSALGVVEALPTAAAIAASRVARGVVGDDVVPLVGPDLPGPGPRRVGQDAPAAAGVDAVFFPSCMGALFAPQQPPGVAEALLALCKRAGVVLHTPAQIASLCCTTPWTSKGLTAGAQAMAGKTFDALWQASDGGRLPIVCDASSCTHGLAGLGQSLDTDRQERWSGLRVVDAVTWVREQVLPRLVQQQRDPGSLGRRLATVVVHPTCSVTQLGIEDDVRAVATMIAEKVVVPVDSGCCAFAGDRGMLHPELTRAATRPEAREIARFEREHGLADAYLSSNRTCEMGMSRATGREYRHVLDVLEELTRPEE